ncbi:Lrp/AsnC ligand binding domain-containing protein [Streptomyces sp. NPDC051453]|uniref:Lrp/AsnC family transcriptional regulator n=1 Tax=Streptomyces sp. NPDC051453 TaxID=3154941 RepID=UPI00342A3D12
MLHRGRDQHIGSGSLCIDIEYDTARLGFTNGAVLWITAAPASPDSVGRALSEHREIACAAATAGPSNLVATVVTRDTAALYAYISGRLGPLEGVQHVETSPFKRKVKRLTYQPPVR